MVDGQSRTFPRPELSPEDGRRVPLDLSEQLKEIASVFQSLVGMPPQVSIRPVKGPGTTPGVVSELRYDVLDVAVALTIVGSPLEELEVRSHDPKVMRELMADFERNLVTEATKRPFRSFAFEVRNGHAMPSGNDHAFGVGTQGLNIGLIAPRVGTP
jgi:hypothetical protein